jgi:hypothetical protein
MLCQREVASGFVSETKSSTHGVDHRLCWHAACLARPLPIQGHRSFLFERKVRREEKKYAFAENDVKVRSRFGACRLNFE